MLKDKNGGLPLTLEQVTFWFLHKRRAAASLSNKRGVKSTLDAWLIWLGNRKWSCISTGPKLRIYSKRVIKGQE